ncbi:MAG: TrkH family potassium uptake protein [Rhizobiaceae bacterium]|nr:TrkH family potassium uptake protein [Rhizobiaceae bacterium]
MIRSLRPILLILGLLLTTLGVAMFIPALVDLVANNRDWEVFAFSGGLTLLIGLGLYAGNRDVPQSMSTRQAFVMTCAAWVSLSFVGAIPYYLSGVVPSFTDAFFESMSGLTTTGSTVIEGLEAVPPGILLWRGIQQWLGGLGIIVMAVAVLPMLQVGGMQLFKIEAFDTAEKIMPRATQISGSLTMIFIFFTALCSIAYMLAGMGVMDATVHAMTTVATGGFSTKDGSIGHFNSETIELISIVFMILGSIPFILFVQGFQGNPSRIWKNSQVKVFLVTLAIFSVIAWSLHPAGETAPRNSFLEAAFSVTSIMTGTGYSAADYGQWTIGANAFFFMIMFIGGCAGSTSCGIKIFRFQVMFETIRQHVSRVFYPNGIFIMRFNDQPIDDGVSSAVMNFFAVYFLLFGVFALLLNLTGLDFLTAMSAAGTAISNVGPGLGDLIGPHTTFKELNDPAKWILSAAMLVGRLELFTVLVLFIPRFWMD